MRSIKIAISGRSGCGNTSVSRHLAERLAFRFINFTFRSLAEEQNISFNEALKLANEDSWWDLEVDRRQVDLARQEGSCVLGSRLAIWMLEEADLKIWLNASEQVRAQRIHRREGGNIQEIADFTRIRDAQDTARYKKLYGIDNHRHDFADLIIETDNLDVQEIVQLICDKIRRDFPDLPCNCAP